MADISRPTWRKENNYSAVRMQQGRVTVDADPNEQIDIAAWQLRATTRDVVGPSGTPWDTTLSPPAAPGFAITSTGTNLKIGAGRYYVDGRMVENHGERAVLGARGAASLQPGFRQYTAAEVTATTGATSLPAGVYLIYLDVWEREITWIQDGLVRDVALGGPDTATRTERVWQVRLMPTGLPGTFMTNPDCKVTIAGWTDLSATRGTLLAFATSPAAAATPCSVPPTAGYRGPENQLYRVEIHRGGTAADARFKWSRENASVIGALDDVELVAGVTSLIVERPATDSVLGFDDNGWVEVGDDQTALRAPLPGEADVGAFPLLVRVADVEGASLALSSLAVDATRDGVNTATLAGLAATFPDHPYVRRWEGDAGHYAVSAATGAGGFELEEGVFVRFAGTRFRAGDHWMIPARIAEGTVEWPSGAQEPPHGTEHSYARLGFVAVAADGTFGTVHDCRPIFTSLTDQGTLVYVAGDGQSYAPDVALAPLVVGVYSPIGVVSGVQVRFDAPAGVTVNGGSTATVTTDVDGLAQVTAVVTNWSLSQVEVTATLVISTTAPHFPAIRFRAQRDLALHLEGGDGQVGLPGRQLPAPVAFSVVTRGSLPVQGARIGLTASNGTLALTTLTTDANGRASTTWTLGTDVRTTPTLHAVLHDPDTAAPIGPTAAAAPQLDLSAAFAAIRMLGGDAQHGPAGQTLPVKLRVGLVEGRVAGDGVKVQFHAIGGGTLIGNTTGPTVTADLNELGHAEVAWVLGSATEQRVQAAILPGSTATRAWVHFHAVLTVPSTKVGIGIKRILAGETGLTVVNQVLPATELKGGQLRIFLDGPYDDEQVGHPTVELYGEITPNQTLAPDRLARRVHFETVTHGEGSAELRVASSELVSFLSSVTSYDRPILSGEGRPTGEMGVRMRLCFRGDFTWQVNDTARPVPRDRVGDIEYTFWVRSAREFKDKDVKNFATEIARRPSGSSMIRLTDGAEVPLVWETAPNGAFRLAIDGEEIPDVARGAALETTLLRALRRGPS